MDYAELLVEVRQRTGVAGAIERGEYYTLNAEKMLEKALKVAQMEVDAVLGFDGDGFAALPSDCLQLIFPEPAIVRGGNLIGTPDADQDIRYYQKLSTVTNGGSNWLIEDEPEIYVQAVALQVYLSNNMADQAVATSTLLKAMIDGLQTADTRYRYMNRRINIVGLQ